MKKLCAIFLCLSLLLASACTQQPEPKPGEADYSAVYAVIKENQEKFGVGSMRGFNDAAAVNEGTADKATASYSKTNTQIEGIDESDRIKTDGSYIYYLAEDEVAVYRADGENSERVASVSVKSDGMYASGMYLEDGVLAVISTGGMYDCCVYPGGAAARVKTTVSYYDVSAPENARLIAVTGQDGQLMASRMYDGRLYLVTQHYVTQEAVKSEPATYVPQFYSDSAAQPALCEKLSIAQSADGTSYAVIGAYSVKTGELLSQRSVLGTGETLYMNESGIYLASGRCEETIGSSHRDGSVTVTEQAGRIYTDIMRIAVSDLSPTAEGSVEGMINDQFSLDEYDGALRVVTTDVSEYYKVYKNEDTGIESYEYDDKMSVTKNNLFILDENLRELSSVKELAPGETVYSVRFDGETVYFCTFRQVDPLFAVDVSDKTAPKVLSALKISGFSEYLHAWNEGRLFGLGQEADEKTGVSGGLKLVMFSTENKADVSVKHSLELKAMYTQALTDHTALLILPEKNLIGFEAEDVYRLFSYSDAEGFVSRGEYSVGSRWRDSRAVCIGEYIYLISCDGIQCLS